MNRYAGISAILFALVFSLLLPASGARAQDLDFADLNGTLPSGATTLSGTVTITGDLTVPSDGTLIVQAGTTVRSDGYWTSIFVEGVLQIDGTSTNSVTLTSLGGNSDSPWGGIKFQPGSSGSITHAQFSYGGGELSGIIEIDDASVTVSQSTFRNSDEDGIRVRNIDGINRIVLIENCTFADNADNDGIECNDATPTIAACTFTDNNNAIYLTGTSFPHFRGDLTADDGIWLASTTYDRDGTWEYAGVPYILDGDITVPEGIELTIEPGIIVKGNDYWNSILVDGALNIDGNTVDPVIFTSMQDDTIGGDTNKDANADEPSVPEPNNWGGIKYNPGSSGAITHAQFAYGGGEISGMVEIDDADVTVRQSVFHDSGEDGIRVRNIDGVNRTVLIEDCTFTDINNSGSDAIECNNASPTITACSFTNNNAAVWLVDGTSFPRFNGDLVADDGIWLANATYDRDGTWEYAGIPYILDGDITIPEGTALIVEPGIVVKGNDYWNSILVDGHFSAFGKPDSAIVFTSMRDDFILGDTNKDGDESVAEPGNWGGIYVRGDGIARLHYSHLLYGGGESRGLIESIDGGMAILENSLLAHSDEDGLYAGNGGKGALRYCSILDNRDLGVRNQTQGTHFDADDNNWWGDPSGPLDTSDADGRVNPDGLGGEVGDYVDYEPWSSVQPALGKIVVPEDPTIPDPPEIAQVSTDRTEYTTDQPIVVTFSGFPGNQEDWISLSPITLPDDQYSSWWTYTSGQTSGSFTFDPLPAGRYEVRAYFNWPDGGYEVHRRYSFLVRGEEPTPDLEPVVTSLIAESNPTEGADIATLRATISLMEPQTSSEVAVAQRFVPAIADKTGRAKAARVMALTLTNQHLTVAVSDEQGYFDINTAGDSHLIYGDGGTSYANVYIDGQTHKYGRDTAGSFTATPTQDGSAVTSSWQIGDIAVTQRVSLVRSAVTGKEDAAWIQYELRNVGTAAHQVGLYLQMDTMVGSNDAAPLSTSYGYSAVDQEFTRANMPTFWQAFEQGPTQSEEKLVAQGTLVGAGAVPPDRFVVGPYDRLSDVGWEYSVRGNSYGDSAVGMWWNPLSLAPGASRTIATFYGLGQGAVSAGTLALNVSAPVELTAVGGLLSPNPFEVNVLVSNTGSIGVDGVQVEIDLPQGLSLMSGETASKSLNPGRLEADQTGQASWKVRAVAAAEPTELSYTVHVVSTSSSVEGNQLTRTISIPAAAPSLYIAAAEAFTDDDPGEGQGWAMSPIDGAYDDATEVAELTLDVSDWEPGVYPIAVRGRSSDGLWGATRLVTLDVTGDAGGGTEPPPPDIEVPSDYATIQEALNAAEAGQVIAVTAGIYEENIRLREGVSLIGAAPEMTIIDGGGSDVVWGADNALISGFTLRNGGDAGVFTWSNSPTIENCIITGSEQGIATAARPLIRGNVITGNSDYGIFVGTSSSLGTPAQPTIENNLIVGNLDATGITLYKAGGLVINNTIDANGTYGINLSPADPPVQVDLRNNLVTNNGWNGINGYAFDDELQTIGYNDVWNNGWDDYDDVEPGEGSISADPLYLSPFVPADDSQAAAKPIVPSADLLDTRSKANEARSLSGPAPRVPQPTAKLAVTEAPLFDYHLGTGSPAIDAGDPGTAYLDVDGSRNDMGAYGGNQPLGATVPDTGEEPEPIDPPEPVGEGTLAISPASPTTADAVTLAISGDFPAANAAVQSHSHEIANDLIAVSIATEWTADVGATVITPWSIEEALGALDAGDYQIAVEVNDKPFLSSTLTVTEPVATEESPVSIDFDMADGNQGQTTAGGAVAGATYELQLHVSDAPEISGWSATIEFAPTQIKYSTGSFQASSFVPGMIALADEKESSVGVGGTVLGTNATGSGDGLLATLTFEILEGFADSTHLIVTEMSFKRTDGQEDKRTVRFAATLTSEVTEQPLAGDFDGNDSVDFSDFFLFADQFGKEVPMGSPYDLSPDGKVDFSDFFVFADQFGQSRGKLIALAQELLGLPISPELLPNYPNPFNSSTLIPYQLGEQADVRLDLFNLLGQRVRTLVDRRQQPGLYRATWDGQDEQGRSLTSGLYIYRLRAGEYVEQRSMMLLR